MNNHLPSLATLISTRSAGLRGLLFACVAAACVALPAAAAPFLPGLAPGTGLPGAPTDPFLGCDPDFV